MGQRTFLLRKGLLYAASVLTDLANPSAMSSLPQGCSLKFEALCCLTVGAVAEGVSAGVGVVRCDVVVATKE
jgi:hypothetical protein